MPASWLVVCLVLLSITELYWMREARRMKHVMPPLTPEEVSAGATERVKVQPINGEFQPVGPPKTIPYDPSVHWHPDAIQTALWGTSAAMGLLGFILFWPLIRALLRGLWWIVLQLGRILEPPRPAALDREGQERIKTD